MLTQIQIKNFRGFKDHKVDFKVRSILVGQNNAGKSTMVEALRLISIVVSRYQGLTYKSLPDWLDLPSGTKGVMPSLKNTGVNFLSIFYLYGDPPGEISAKFINKESITIFIGPEEELFCVIYDSKGKVVINKSHAHKVDIPWMGVLPQITPLEKEENILRSEYVVGLLGSTLTSRHFRNQLYVFRKYFGDFKKLAEKSWPGLKIDTLIWENPWPGEKLSLLVRDGNFEGEVGWMGHGLQMWLQIVWFLVLHDDHHTIILDEPDVYMHPDLQRILYRLIKNKYSQLMIATHSTEIIAEAEPEEILLIKKENKKSKFADSLPAVQEIVEKVGSIHNLHLTRIWHSNRFLIVEGDDVDFLKCFQNIIFPDSLIPIKTIPQSTSQGWGGWVEVRSLSKIIKNSGGKTIKTYCLLDRDYHCQEEIDKRMKEAKNRDINLHIWSKKEIENFLLIPKAIQRFITNHCRKDIKPPIEKQIIRQMEKIAESMKNHVFDQLSQEYILLDKKGGAPKANPKARKHLNEKWKTQDGRFSIIPGKEAVSCISNWSQKKYRVSISPRSLASHLTIQELGSEIKMVLTAIENVENF